MITTTDLLSSIPLLIIAGSALLILIVEGIFPKHESKAAETIIFYFSILALIAGINFAFADINKNFFIYNNFIKVSNFSALLQIIMMFGVLITVLSSRDYLKKENVNYGEYYSLLFLALLGMMMMVSANDLLIVFIGIELMSICFYIMSGFMRKKLYSNESALKYFLLGAFLTGFLLLGIAFVYGTTGSTNFGVIKGVNPVKSPFYNLGLVLIFIAFIFKTGSFPLQMWVPDVYQGSPTVVAGMMSSVGKAAAFGTMLAFFYAFSFNTISLIIAVVAIATMLYGNVVALKQTDIKRLLAYSSIAHAGYIMVGFVSQVSGTSNAIIFYLISYVLMQMGAFIVLGLIEAKQDSADNNHERNTFEYYKGLGKTHPILATLFSIFLFSLAGIPPFAGFWGKYYIFLAVIQANLVWLAIVGILLSLIGVYYYIKVVLYMWFYEPVGERIEVKADLTYAAVGLSVIGIFAFGIFPELVLKYIKPIL